MFLEQDSILNPQDLKNLNIKVELNVPRTYFQKLLKSYASYPQQSTVLLIPLNDEDDNPCYAYIKLDIYKCLEQSFDDRMINLGDYAHILYLGRGLEPPLWLEKWVEDTQGFSENSLLKTLH